MSDVDSSRQLYILSAVSWFICAAGGGMLAQWVLAPGTAAWGTFELAGFAISAFTVVVHLLIWCVREERPREAMRRAAEVLRMSKGGRPND